MSNTTVDSPMCYVLVDLCSLILKSIFNVQLLRSSTCLYLVQGDTIKGFSLCLTNLNLSQQSVEETFILKSKQYLQF